MNQRMAIIDLGTNTFHLLIAERGDSRTLALQHRQQVPVKLMDEGFQQGQIGPEAYERGLQAIRDFKQQVDLYQAQVVRILGTSALRSADNAPAFLQQVESVLDCPVSLIDGNQEAGYIYEGVKEAVGLGDEQALILDIGGGSVEFIIANQHALTWKTSLEIGAARLIGQFPHDYPMTEAQKGAIRTYLAEQLAYVLPIMQAYQPVSLVGASGFFETFVNLDRGMVPASGSDGMPLQYELSPDRFQELEEKVLASSTGDLYEMPGMEGFRVPMMGVSTLLVRYLLNQLHLRSIYYANYAMKEGALAAYIKGLNEDPAP